MAVEILESAKIQMQINEKITELQKIQAQGMRKQAEIEDLKVRQSAARAEEFKRAVDAEVKRSRMGNIATPGQGQIQN